jgi:TRAP-type mannitol/chloroaromatic compound transport system permease small subunit
MIKKIFRVFERIIEWISEYGLVLSGIMIMIMTVLSTYGVGRRYIFNSPEPYSYDISTMLLLACVVFSVAGLQWSKRHLRVDFLASFFPDSVQNFLMDILTPILGLFYVFIITWKSWENFLYSFNIGEKSLSAWQELLWPIKLMVPLGMALLCLVLLIQLAHGIISISRGIIKKQ